MPSFLRGRDSEAKQIRRQEFFYNLVTELAEGIKKNQRATSFTVGYKTWNVSEYEKKSPLLGRISSFFHNAGSSNVIRLKITDNFRIPYEKWIPIQGYWNANELAENAFNQRHAQRSFNPDRILKNRFQGVLEAERCGELITSEQLLTPTFSSPFTTLSAKAFQKYEKEYSGSDYFCPEATLTCLQLHENELQLIKKSTLKDKNQIEQTRINKKTIDRYVSQIIQENGEEKFKYISYLYKLDFKALSDNGMPLTPEHVYRMNIGLQNIEVDEVKQLFTSLKDLYLIIACQDPREPLINALSQISSRTFPINPLRGIIQILQREKKNSNVPLRVEDLQKWLQTFEQYNTKSISQLPPHPLNLLTEVLTLSKEDQARNFTGRRIDKVIKAGGYTLAEGIEQKPWIDQQELLHFFSELEEASSFHSYYEKLAHVLCKKHLFRQHPILGCKTGAIIPAPRDLNGNKRWYQVEESIYNGYGKVCYSLTPLGNDKSLPHIKLYRSTASNKANAFNAKSVRNDANPLNCAGYEGKNRSEQYENPFIHKRTLLVWVAYLMQAQKCLNEFGGSPSQEQLAKVHSLLTKANHELKATESDSTKILTLGDIMRKHDGILNTFFSIKQFDATFFNKLRSNHILSKTTDKEKIKADAKAMLNLLPDFDSELVRTGLIKKYNTKLIDQWTLEVKALRKEINDHLLSNAAEVKRNEILDNLNDEIFSKSHSMNVHSNYLEVTNLIKWSNILHMHAEKLKETIEFKNPGDLVYLGHSLGGGLAQVGASDLIKSHRVPCPSHKFSTIAFDAPGIHQEDNILYNEFIKKHHELFVEQDIKFEIYHQHEAHDPVPAGGIHLGGANSKEEANILKNLTHFKFTGLVMSRMKNVNHPDIRDVKTVHETRFLEGIEGLDYEAKRFCPKKLGILELGNQFKGITPHKAEDKSGKLSDKFWQYPLRPSTANRLQKSTWVYWALYCWFGEEWVIQDPRYTNEIDSAGMLCARNDGLAK